MQLNETNAGRLAIAAGLPSGSGQLIVDDLSGGGVSNAVFRVESDRGCAVVKQPFARLRVDVHWEIDRVRICREADAMRFWQERVDRTGVPTVLQLDQTNYILTMTCAPPGYTNWKTRLLAGSIQPAVAQAIGRLLADWQLSSARNPRLARRFPSHDTFRQGRLEPYLGGQLRSRHPGAAAQIAALATELGAAGVCLVHGDYSPKNVMSDPSGNVFLLDFEICHYGHPAFDPAFMLAHLLIKSQHLPRLVGDYVDLARTFWENYRERLGDWLMPGQEVATTRCLGGLLLARVNGKSPVEYLVDPLARKRVLHLGHSLLSGRIATVAGACQSARCA